MVSVFAPVNIAWIKYMGKVAGQPSNPSLSMTLSKSGTQTRIRRIGDAEKFEFRFSEQGYVPPPVGLAKVDAFLSDLELFRSALEPAGFPVKVTPGIYQIYTRNTVPAGTGIATSASGFAALTLAWAGVLCGADLQRFRDRYSSDPVLRLALAAISARGSGSSCRSFGGPFVEWDPDSGITEWSPPESYTDFILLLETSEKAVSSSEAHQRVRTSPGFAGREERVRARLGRVRECWSGSKSDLLPSIVLEEAIDMHELFHTSQPSFRYFNAESEAWIRRIRKSWIPGNDQNLPSKNAILTFDAGANAHLFVPSAEAPLWAAYLAEAHPGLRTVMDGCGKGARFDDSDF
jgi:diphosphomevalonate decarboxylase